MVKFVWLAKDKFGRSEIKEVPANSAAESKEILSVAGYTEPELLVDEIGAEALATLPQKITVLGEEARITHADMLKHRGKPPLTFSRAILESLAKNKLVSIVLILLVTSQIYLGNPVSALLLGVGYIAWMAFFICAGLPSIYYARLHKADEWHRRREVLELVKTAKRISQFHFIRISPVELARFRSKALAGLGRLSEALEEYKQCENQPGCPTWLYHAFVAAIYDAAKEHDKAVEQTRKSLELNWTPAVCLDLAHRLLHYKKNAVDGREALMEAEKGLLSDIAKPFLLRCHGILAYLEGDFDAARRELEAALEIQVRNKHQPYIDANLSLTRGYLSCVLARQGDLPGARNYFSQAEKYMVATNQVEMVEKCRKALGA